MVLDMDDAIHLPYESRRMLSRKFPRLISRCAMVLSGNRYLQEYALQFNPRSVLFPTVVDHTRIVPGPPRASESWGRISRRTAEISSRALSATRV